MDDTRGLSGGRLALWVSVPATDDHCRQGTEWQTVTGRPETCVFWSAIYATIGSIHVIGLVLRGFAYLLYLAIPGLAVFAWYLYLVASATNAIKSVWRSSGRCLRPHSPGRTLGRHGHPDPLGWLLWALTWAQSDRLHRLCLFDGCRQRRLASVPDILSGCSMGLPALSLTSLNLLLVGALGVDGVIALALVIAYLPQWLEALGSTWHPAVGAKPASIGLRQLGISVLYTVLFVWTW